MLKRFLLFLMLFMLALVPMLVLGQATGVYAEAVGTANLRAFAGTDADIVGEISTGTRYPVVGRSELYPWVLLGDVATNQPIGWVFQDLVTVYGDLTVVPISTLNVNALPTETPTITPTTDPNVTVIPSETPTPTPPFAVYGIAQGEINIRYEPDVSAARLGVGQAGDRFEVVGYHTQFPWVQIRYENSPEGLAWVAKDLLQIEGDLFSTRAIVTTQFNLPTLTPTSVTFGTSSIDTGATPVPRSLSFEALGNRLWGNIIEAGFDPQTSRFGALYLQNLETGEELVFGNDVAFSGTSINKIAILLRVFGKLETLPDAQMATDIANTMICSENVATNRLLAYLGDGNDYIGADVLTDSLRSMGLRRTFLTAPYLIPGKTPEPPPVAIEYPETDADQQKANPNVTNQMTVDELGYMMSSIYQCAYNESGPLMDRFAGEYTSQECRKMVHVMASNTVDALLKAGVPEGVAVAHKHGWVDDTHGNAAIIFTPGGDFVMVMMLHEPTWLDFPESLPVIAESSRLVYNYLNPDAQLPEIREGYIPTTEECNYNAASPIVLDLMSSTYGMEVDTPPLEPNATTTP